MRTLADWKKQTGFDKVLYEQAKHMKKRGFGGAVSELVGYYGKNYRESLSGYNRALKRSKLKKVM
jgi:hypothetical protein